MILYRVPLAGLSSLTRRSCPAGQTLRDRLMASMGPRYTSVEEYRLNQSDRYEKHWKRWGPYVSERQWVSETLGVV